MSEQALVDQILDIAFAGSDADVRARKDALWTVDLVHVPYRGGGPVMTDLLGGQVQVLFGSTSLTIEQIRAGKLRPLAVTTATRWEGLPDIPTVNDFVSGYEASAVSGLGAPRNTPAEIIDKLNKEINAALADHMIATGISSGTRTLYTDDEEH